MELGPETQLCEHYFLLREEPETMGSSLFGRVWTALDVDTDEVVRVVVVDPELLPSEAARTAFLERMREVIERLADALVPLKDVGSEGDHCVLIFGAPQGTFPLPDITAEMSQESRRNEARRFAVHLARSVAELHRKGVVHGLLDPSTVFEWERGYAVWQYEIARLCERDVIEIRLAGSPMDAYRAPEATVGDDLVPASDIYSWAALVAQFPSQESVYEAIAQINDGSAAELFGEQLLALLKQALKEEPSERFTDGAALVAAIEAAGLHKELPISRAGTGNSVWEWELTRDRRRQKSLTAMRSQLAPSDRSWEYHEPEPEPAQEEVPETAEATEEVGSDVAPAADNEEAGAEVNGAEEAARAGVDDAEVDDAGSDEVTAAEQVRTEEAEQPGLPDYGDYAPDVTEGLEDDDEAAADRAVEEVADTLSPADIAALEAQDAREAEALAQTEDRLEASRQSLEAREKLEAAIRLAARQAAQRRAEKAQAEQAAEQARAAEEARQAEQAEADPTKAGVKPVADEDDTDLSAATRRASELAGEQREMLAERARTQTTPDVRDDYETPAWALEAAERAAREVAEEAAREAEEAAAAEAEQAEQQARAVEEAEALRAARQAAAIRDDDEGLFNELLGETETTSSVPLERYDMGPLPPMPGEEFQAPEPKPEPKPEPVADAPVAARQAPSSPAVATRRRGVSAAERAKAEEAARIARERVRRSVANRRKTSGTYAAAEASGEVQKRALILNAPPESWGADEPSLAMPITAPAVAQARQEAQPSPAAASQPATEPAKQTIITETNEMTPAMKIMLVVLFALILIMMCNR